MLCLGFRLTILTFDVRLPLGFTFSNLSIDQSGLSWAYIWLFVLNPTRCIASLSISLPPLLLVYAQLLRKNGAPKCANCNDFLSKWKLQNKMRGYPFFYSYHTMACHYIKLENRIYLRFWEWDQGLILQEFIKVSANLMWNTNTGSLKGTMR